MGNRFLRWLLCKSVREGDRDRQRELEGGVVVVVVVGFKQDSNGLK